MDSLSEVFSYLRGISCCKSSDGENPANQSQHTQKLNPSVKWLIYMAIFMVPIFITYHRILENAIIQVVVGIWGINKTTQANSVRRDLRRRRGVSWKQAIVAGAITSTFGIIAVVAVLVANACGATLTDAVGLTRDASDQDNLSACGVAGSVLATSYYAVSRANAYSECQGWL